MKEEEHKQMLKKGFKLTRESCFNGRSGIETTCVSVFLVTSPQKQKQLHKSLKYRTESDT